MGKRRWLKLVASLAILLSPSLALATSAGDPSYSSANYSIIESYVGGAGDQNSSSSSYTSGGSTLGDTAVGSSSSTSYSLNSGSTTTNDPNLTFIVDNGSVNMGTLSSVAATTATATFHVENYTSYGYAVTMVGNAPKSGSHTLAALATDTASVAGTEQFGVNTVANTSPVAVGANPVENPSTNFSYGVAGTGTSTPYALSNKYRFVSGDSYPVASAAKSSGLTDYTMSFMANISPTTPGGTYTGAIALICTGTY